MPLYIFKVTRKLHQKYFSFARILWFIIRRSKIFGCELWIHFKVELLQIVYRSFMHPCLYVCVCLCSLHSIVVIYKIFTGHCLFLQIHIFNFIEKQIIISKFMTQICNFSFSILFVTNKLKFGLKFSFKFFFYKKFILKLRCCGDFTVFFFWIFEF